MQVTNEMKWLFPSSDELFPFGQVQPKLKSGLRAIVSNSSVGGLLDIANAADLLGVSAKWLYRNYRDLPHVLIPAGKRPRIRFRRSDLEQWIANHSFDWRKRR